MKFIQLIITIAFISCHLQSCAQGQNELPISGNTFSSKPFDGTGIITLQGLEKWKNADEIFTTYFRVSRPGSAILSINKMLLFRGKSTLQFSINNQPKTINIVEDQQNQGYIGEWMIKDTGYVALQIKGLTKSYKSFPAIASLNLTGTAVNSDTRFVRNNDGNFYHWGRRGPSVHLSYNVSKKINASWYYNEVTIPKNNDVIGSYYMAIGFNEGYFGIQVNSETERRILFSVWSPSNTDDPKSVPKSSQVQLLAKGNDVYTGEFGGEGSGGQSYLKYNWTAGTTYKFLVHGVPGADKTTTYTAYFCPSNGDKWQLIASFKRPLTQTYLKGFYSFLENFAPEGGAITRSVLFDNQWVCNDKGNWIEINACRFTTDDTGNKKYRMDYAGGLSGNQFYLKNCGFFNKFSLPGTVFTRILTNNKPLVDFDQLP